MPSIPFRALLLASVVSLGCSSDDPSVERRGGPLPTPNPDGSAGETSVGVAGSGGTSAESIPFCDALAVIRAKCQRCHQAPPLHGAPVPFLTYADTQAPYGTSEFKYTDVMLPAVEAGRMPSLELNGPPTNLMPPVEPLTAVEKETLVGWLRQGGLPQGGTDCP
jgi:hypothetical protein